MSDESIYQSEIVLGENSSFSGTASSSSDYLSKQLNNSELYDKDTDKSVKQSTEAMDKSYDAPKIIKVKQYRLYKRNVNG